MSKSEGNGSFFWHEVNEMNEKLSFEMGAKLPVYSRYNFRKNSLMSHKSYYGLVGHCVYLFTRKYILDLMHKLCP